MILAIFIFARLGIVLLGLYGASQFYTINLKFTLSNLFTFWAQAITYKRDIAYFLENGYMRQYSTGEFILSALFTVFVDTTVIYLIA